MFHLKPHLLQGTLQGTQRLRTTRGKQCTHSSYHDTPHTEDVFYIFNIGKYNAKQHYTMGLTNDIHTAKFMHAKTFPVAMCMYETPIENNHAAVTAFLTTIPSGISPVYGSTYSPQHILLTDDIQPYIQHIDTLVEAQERFGGGS